MELQVRIELSDDDIKNWDYNESIAKVSTGFVPKWKKLSKEILEELYQAKVHLSRKGNPYGKKTWSGFVEEALGGVTVRTADNWIRRYRIGEKAWKEEQAKKKKQSKPVDTDSLLIIKDFKADGKRMLHLRVLEYPEIIFLEEIIL